MAIAQMETHTSFVEPKSLAEAEARRDMVWKEIQAIETQLSNPRVLDPVTRKPMSNKAWKRWRYRTIEGLNAKHLEHRQLRTWIQQRAAGPLTRVADLAEELIKAGVADLIPEQREDLKLILGDLTEELQKVKPSPRPVKSVRQL